MQAVENFESEARLWQKCVLSWMPTPVKVSDGKNRPWCFGNLKFTGEVEDICQTCCFRDACLKESFNDSLLHKHDYYFVTRKEKVSDAKTPA